MKLKNFTESDWDAYSGCNSGEPFIGEFQVQHLMYDHVLEWDAILILDDERIQIDTISNEMEMEIGFYKVFESKQEAHSFASRLETCSGTYLLAMGFKVA